MVSFLGSLAKCTVHVYTLLGCITKAELPKIIIRNVTLEIGPSGTQITIQYFAWPFREQPLTNKNVKNLLDMVLH